MVEIRTLPSAGTEADPIRTRTRTRTRTREGMAIAKAAGKLRGRKRKLTASQEKHLVQLHRTGDHTTSEIAELFDVARSTVYRAIQRASQE